MFDDKQIIFKTFPFYILPVVRTLSLYYADAIIRRIVKTFTISIYICNLKVL